MVKDNDFKLSGLTKQATRKLLAMLKKILKNFNLKKTYKLFFDLSARSVTFDSDLW
jgi:hypothetical protein